MKISRKESAVRRAKIAAYVNSGKTVGSAAKKFGMSIPTVREACWENDVPYKTKNGQAMLRVVARLIVGTETCAEISRRKDILVSRAYVSEVAKDALRCRIPIHKRYRHSPR